MSFIFCIIGSFLTCFFIKTLYKILVCLYKKFVRKPYNLIERYGDKSYVIVTGATSGIGKEFCNQFAKLGFNLILVSRNKSRLLETSNEFKQLYSDINIEIIEFDFTKKYTLSDYLTEFNNEKINNLDISILVNNIGVSKREFFANYTYDDISDSIKVNIISQSFLTKIFIEKFLKRKNKCAIISMSSYSANLPLVLSSMYCSTKIFDDYLIRSIASENIGKNIDFLSVKPLYVNTPSRALHSKEFKAISSEDCVKGILQDLGYEHSTYGHYSHYLKALLLDYIPVRIQNMIRLMSHNKKK